MEALGQVEFLQTALVTVGFLVVLATTLGFVLQRTAGGTGIGGAVLLGLASLGAGLFCIGGIWLGVEYGDEYFEPHGPLIGLLAGMLLGGALISFLLGRFVQGHSGRFMAAQWFSFCALCLVGYLAGGQIGLLTITLPCLVMFWVVLSRIACYTLPLREDCQESMAFRCLLTHAMGTNYPYHVVRGGEVEDRYPGIPFLQFFAGPGIVYADPDQGAYVDNNRSIRQIFGPGLNFTRVFEENPRALDLRPQVRSFPITALTKDGISVHSQVTLAFRLRHSRQPSQPGESFHSSQRTASQIATSEYVEGGRQPAEAAGQHRWDGQLVALLVTPILQDIVSRKSVDELCAPRIQQGGPQPHIRYIAPRTDIAAELRTRTRRALHKQGVELVEIWFDNLSPRDLSVLRRRIHNWRAACEQYILRLMSQGQADRSQKLEEARGEAEREILDRFKEIVDSGQYDPGLSQTALALRFIDSLGEVLSESAKQWPMPESYEETLRTLRGELEDGQR